MTRFKAPVEHPRTTEERQPGRFPGMPVGVQWNSDWFQYTWDFNRIADLPVTGVGWTITATGAGVVTLTDDVFPSAASLTNAAADDDSLELQWTAADGSGELVAPQADCPIYFEILMNVSDVNADQAAVEQVDWFVGLAATDTTVIDGTANFIGFLKRDVTVAANSRINFVCGDAGGAAGALVDQFVSATGWISGGTLGVNIAANRAARRMGPGELIKLAFLVEPRVGGTVGAAYAWVNDELTPNSPMTVSGFIPLENLCPTVCVQNGEAVAKVFGMSRIIVAQSLRTTSGVLATFAF